MGKKKFLVKSIDNKRDAKFEKLLENSVILKTKIVDAKKLHLKTDQKRTISITFLLLTFLYTFITKCILKNFSFDIIVIANIFLLFTALYLNITGNSIYSLHHQQKQQIINTIHHVVNLFIFGYTFCLFIEKSMDYASQNQEIFDQIYNSQNSAFMSEVMCCVEMFKLKPLYMLSFLYSCVMFIPTLIFTIKNSLFNMMKTILFILPIINIIVVFKILVGIKRFKEYKRIDEKTFEIRYRKITNVRFFGFKLFKKAVTCIGYIISYYFLIYYFIMVF